MLQSIAHVLSAEPLIVGPGGILDLFAPSWAGGIWYSPTFKSFSLNLQLLQGRILLPIVLIHLEVQRLKKKKPQSGQDGIDDRFLNVAELSPEEAERSENLNGKLGCEPTACLSFFCLNFLHTRLRRTNVLKMTHRVQINRL